MFFNVKYTLKVTILRLLLYEGSPSCIGGYDSCQCCEIVGLFLLDQISKVVPPHRHGLYRDDGMLALLAHGGDQDDIRKALVKIFADNNLTITYKVNVKLSV